MLGDRHEIARFQSDFYRDNYHKMLRVVLVEMFIALALIVAIIYFIFFQAPPRYYATATTGQVMALNPAR